jgi:fatty acid desaturase
MATPPTYPGGGGMSDIHRSGQAGCMTIEMALPAPAPPATETGAPTEFPVGDRPGSDYAVLSKRIAAAGLLRRRTAYYVVRTIVVAALLVGSWVAIAVLGSSWWVLALAPVMAIVFAQIALLSHDIAHRQVFRTRRSSEIAGWIAGNTGMGMSYGWWMDKHTRHHANPNHEERDPDVSPDLLVWSQRQARKSKGIARFIGRRQALLFVPLLTLEGVNLRVSSVRALLKPGIRGRRIEAATLVAHFVVYFTLLFTLLPPLHALAFIAIHQAIFGVYLGATFAPNHKGMPMLTEDDDLDFLRKQVLTSRNVIGGPVLNAAMGGLNHQIEHHLFPSMPSANLTKARPIVRDYCREIGVPYHESRLLNSYRLALVHLHRAGAPLRQN